MRFRDLVLDGIDRVYIAYDYRGKWAFQFLYPQRYCLKADDVVLRTERVGNDLRVWLDD